MARVSWLCGEGLNDYKSCVKTGSSQSGPNEGGKCDGIGLSAACLNKVAMICSVVVVVA